MTTFGRKALRQLEGKRRLRLFQDLIYAEEQKKSLESTLTVRKMTQEERIKYNLDHPKNV